MTGPDTTYRVQAGLDDGRARIDSMLANRVPELSRSRIKALITAGQVTADGATITEPAYRVKPGQSFTVTVPPAVPAVPLGQAMALEIVHEDADIIIIDKPAGLVVHPGPGNPDRTLVNALIAHCGETLQGIGGVRRPGIVHRLDKDTSGLMVVAKTDAAHAALVTQFAARTVARAYHAVVAGVPVPARGELTGNIGRSPRNRKKMAVLGRGGRPAVTRFRVLRPLGSAASLVECRLKTGRTHQIRVHLAHIGHGVIGDRLYGRTRRGALLRMGSPLAAAIEGLHGHALHAILLGFRHPASGKQMHFESEIPSDIKRIIYELEAV